MKLKVSTNYARHLVEHKTSIIEAEKRDWRNYVGEKAVELCEVYRICWG